MVGGLINIVSYVSSDIYLVGAPQITFYKMVYRRYTNFAMESVVQEFDNNLEFNRESELVPERAGDLIHKGYVRIRIPRFQVQKTDVGIDQSDFVFNYANEFVVTDFQAIKTVYTSILTDIYRIIYRATKAINVSYQGLVIDVQNYVNQNNRLTLLAQYDTLLTQTRQRLSKDYGNCIYDYAILDYTRSDMWYILNAIDVSKLYNNSASNIDTEVVDPDSQEYTIKVNQIMKDSVLKLMTLALDVLIKVQDIFFTQYKVFLKQIEIDKSSNIRFAWVKNLGFSIVDYLDVYIGGKRIDRHLGIWMNIWYELTHTEAQKRDFNELIGNVSELTNFDTLEKPEYTLYIPMTFWFNKYNGLSFPLIAMQYNDLRFRLKLRRFDEVAFIEKVYRVELDGSEKLMTANILDYYINRAADKGDHTISSIQEVTDISLESIFEAQSKRLDGDMLLDYVYLESKERQKFAQSGHEYLIERIQYEVFENIDRTDLSVKLEFTNPSKELIWVLHKDTFEMNNDSYTECRWDNFTNGIPHKNPVNTFSMDYNGYNRVQRQTGLYFNQYQPITYHATSPDDGINIYSFCTDPLQSQPTGTCNFSKLSEVEMHFTLDTQLLRYTAAELYAYNLDLDFILTLADPLSFANKIDIRSIKSEITLIENIPKNEGRALTVQETIRLDELNSFVEVYDELQSGSNIVQKSIYQKIPLITTARAYIFALSLNILRLIGGYGALAYSGNQ